VISGLLAYIYGSRELKAPQPPPPLDESVTVAPAYDSDGELISPPLGQATERPRVVDFFTDSCPACRTIRPAIDQLAEDCSDGTVEVLTVNLSERRNEHLAARYRVVGVPTISFLGETGQETGRLTGVASRRALRKATTELAGRGCAW